MVQKLKQKVMDGKEITKEEAMTLAEADLDELCQAADEIRKHFCGNVFDICSCINVKGKAAYTDRHGSDA